MTLNIQRSKPNHTQLFTKLSICTDLLLQRELVSDILKKLKLLTTSDSMASKESDDSLLWIFCPQLIHSPETLLAVERCWSENPRSTCPYRWAQTRWWGWRSLRTDRPLVWHHGWIYTAPKREIDTERVSSGRITASKKRGHVKTCTMQCPIICFYLALIKNDVTKCQRD